MLTGPWILEVPHSHLFPGVELTAAQARADGPWLDHADPQRIVLMFADGTEATGAFCAASSSAGVLLVGTHVTGAGATISRQRWWTSRTGLERPRSVVRIVRRADR